VWAEIDGIDDTDALLVAALGHGVAFVPGSAFSVDRRGGRGLRLSFATASPRQLDEAVSRLVAALP
jgi:2-aminoadipate transaminase